MASTQQVLTVKMIATLIEAIDTDDAKDAELALRMIRGLLDAAAEKKA